MQGSDRDIPGVRPRTKNNYRDFPKGSSDDLQVADANPFWLPPYTDRATIITTATTPTLAIR